LKKGCIFILCIKSSKISIYDPCFDEGNIGNATGRKPNDVHNFLYNHKHSLTFSCPFKQLKLKQHSETANISQVYVKTNLPFQKTSQDSLNY